MPGTSARRPYAAGPKRPGWRTSRSAGPAGARRSWTITCSLGRCPKNDRQPLGSGLSPGCLRRRLPPDVDAGEYRRRLGVCDRCPRRAGTRCGMCSVSLVASAKDRHWRCPASRWEDHSAAATTGPIRVGFISSPPLFGGGVKMAAHPGPRPCRTADGDGRLPLCRPGHRGAARGHARCRHRHPGGARHLHDSGIAGRGHPTGPDLLRGRRGATAGTGERRPGGVRGVADIETLPAAFRGAVLLTGHGDCPWTRRIVAAIRSRATHFVAVGSLAAESFLLWIKADRHSQRHRPAAARADPGEGPGPRQWGLKPDEIAVGYVGRISSKNGLPPWRRPRRR